MAFTPTSGSVAKLTITIPGGTADAVLPGTNWKFNIDPKNADVSNFRDGRARTPTLADCSVSLRVWHDQAAPDYLTSGGSPAGFNLVHGLLGTAKLYVDATHYYTLGFIVGPLSPSNDGVESALYQDVTLEQHGGLIYPTG